MSTFSPIDELRVPLRDSTAIFLQNNVNYLQPILDPWYNASTARFLVDDPRYSEVLFYGSSRSLSVLACTEQYQFCNTTSCSIPNGIYNATDRWSGLLLNEAQKVVAEIFREIAMNSTLGVGFGHFGSSTLLSRDNLWPRFHGSISGTLNSNQWEIEVLGTMAMTLAAIQRMVIEFANPSSISFRTADITQNTSDFIAKPNLPNEDVICRNIRLRSANHLNFNAVGLAIVFAISAAIISLNIFWGPRLVFWVRRRLGHGDFSRRQWEEGHMFRLLMAAWQRNGIGAWSTGTGGWGCIPVSTEKGIAFEAQTTWTSSVEAGSSEMVIRENAAMNYGKTSAGRNLGPFLRGAEDLTLLGKDRRCTMADESRHDQG